MGELEDAIEEMDAATAKLEALVAMRNDKSVDPAILPQISELSNLLNSVIKDMDSVILRYKDNPSPSSNPLPNQMEHGVEATPHD